MLEDIGTLSVRAYTASGGLPVEGALVRITGAEEDNRMIAYSLITDRDGKTETVSLPAPKKSNSTAPNQPDSPYAIYDITVSRDGYYTRNIKGVSVFSGVGSIQLVNMIPESGVGNENYPRGNINTVIPDNTTL